MVGVLNVALAQRSMQTADAIRTSVLFFWNDGLWDLDALAHSFVVLRHAERVRDGACPSAASCLRPPNSQSELGFFGFPGSGYGRCRWRLGHALLGNQPRVLGGVRLGLGCRFILSVGVMDNDRASGTQSRLANVRGSDGRDSNRCRPFGGRELGLRNWFRFRHRLAMFKR